MCVIYFARLFVRVNCMQDLCPARALQELSGNGARQFSHRRKECPAMSGFETRLAALQLGAGEENDFPVGTIAIASSIGSRASGLSSLSQHPHKPAVAS